MKKRTILLLFLCFLLLSPVSFAEERSFDEEIIYFLLTDRFNNGDPSNDDPHGIGYDTSHPETYHGGDFKGLLEKLDYLEDLGVTTIWMTPILDNIEFNMRDGKDSQYGYHGYWTKDFTEIDEHLGSLEDFKALLDGIHDRDMKLMLDVVINHTGYGMKETDASDVDHFPTPEEQAVFKDMLRLEPGVGDVEGELAGLPDFKTEDPEVLGQIITWYQELLEKTTTDKGGIDYFRVDTAKHVLPAELKAFKEGMEEVNPDIKMVAEYFDGDIFVNGKVLDEGGMDAVLDFSFKGIVRDYLRGRIEDAESKLINRDTQLTKDRTTAPFLSSHDEDGFLAVNLQGDEGLFKVASTLELTAKGIPVIYYGEEIAQSGKNAGDMDQGEFSENRYDFDWSRTESSDMLDHYKKLLSVRKQNTSIFAEGERSHLYASEDTSVFKRSLDGEDIYVAINLSEEPRTLTISTTGEIQELYEGVEVERDEEGKLLLELPPNMEGGTRIFTSEEPLDDSRFIVESTIETAEPVVEETAEIVPETNSEPEVATGPSWVIILLVIPLGFIIGYFMTKKKKK